MKNFYLQMKKNGKPLCITEDNLVSRSTPLVHENRGSAKISSKVPLASTKYHVLFYNEKRS